ncbi:MAG: hypothetical protein HFE86_01525 [Clostridiales bacterium]|nr:hypothetical protein [Clostridiales bacterium]
MNRTYWFTTVKWLAVIFLVMFLGFQTYQSLYSSYSTESAIYYEDYDGIPITGLVIRDENVITADTAGVMSYTVPEGGRVAKDGLVASVYANESAAQAAVRGEELDEEIAALTAIQQYNDVTAADLDLLDAQIQTAFLSMLEGKTTGRYGSLYTGSGQLLSLLNRKQIVTGRTQDFSGRIAVLQAEKQSLARGAPVQTVTSAFAGYFVSTVDGYEDVLSTEMIEALSPAQLEDLRPAVRPTDGVVGKVVSDYEWYIAANISFSDSLKLKEGTEMTLKTALSTMPDLPVTVKKINKGASGEDVCVVFGCKYMNGELAGIRNQPMTIVLHNYAGLRVNAKAIRIVEGQKGVYVLNGTEAKFVPIEILYAASGYSVCAMSDSTDGLRLYDEIIVKGKNLYNGKVLK